MENRQNTKRVQLWKTEPILSVLAIIWHFFGLLPPQNHKFVSEPPDEPSVFQLLCLHGDHYLKLSPHMKHFSICCQQKKCLSNGRAAFKSPGHHIFPILELSSLRISGTFHHRQSHSLRVVIGHNYFCNIINALQERLSEGVCSFPHPYLNDYHITSLWQLASHPQVQQFRTAINKTNPRP